MSNRLRIGKINYANVWPVFADFPGEQLRDRVQLLEMTPTACNRALLAGDIEMGFISSFAYFQHTDEYVLLPNLSISARGQVSSILLFHERPLEEIASGRIALTNTSATSSHLLRIILETFLGGRPQYVQSAPDLQQMFQGEQADAAMLIGDDAIRASFTRPTAFVTDLGQWWYTQTGHSVTYAVWAVRKAFAEREPQLTDECRRALNASKCSGLAQTEQLVERAQRQFGGERSFWRQYFVHLTYELGDHEIAGLEYYHRCLASLSLVKEPFALNFTNPSPSKQVKP